MEINQVMRFLLPWLPCQSLCRDLSSEAQLCQHRHVQAPSWVHLPSQGHCTPQKPPLCSGAEPWASPEAAPARKQPSPLLRTSPATPEPRLAQAAHTQGPPQQPEWCPGNNSGFIQPVLLQLLHSLHQVLHSPVHVSPGGATAHAQPQRVLGHLWGNPAAQQHWGGPGTQPGGGGLDFPRQRKPHTSAGSPREPQEEPHLQIHSRAPVPCTALLAFRGTQSHWLYGSSQKSLFRVPVGWQLCHIHRALL